MGAASQGDGTPMVPDKLAALEATAAVFADHRVPYALIGGVAMGIRSGVPRATRGVDFAVATRVDRPWLRRALTKHGLSAAGEFVHTDTFRHSSGEPVQLACDAAFDAMIERADAMTFGSLVLHLVTKAPTSSR